MYLLARRIKALGIKVVLSGEGADEVFGGYLYFHKAPSPEEFHKYDPLRRFHCIRHRPRGKTLQPFAKRLQNSLQN